MSDSQNMEETQFQQSTQQMGEKPSDDQNGGRHRVRGGARSVLLALAGLALGLLLCGIGFGFGYTAGRVHGDALRYNGAPWGPRIQDPFNYPDNFYDPDYPPDIPGMNWLLIPGQGIGYACEGWPEPDVSGAWAWLGISVADGDDGPVIGEIVEDGPADLAGLGIDDIILEVDGERTRDYEELVEVLADHDPCEEVTLLIERDGDEEELEAILGGILLAE